ncbi:PEP-CTERM sorting domain-containing protein [Roseiconus lacunae]|uniref:PEP-CTERM sorting domain-containing protein n=1 Tax=Roseiconus lacunae TaxID=2605694 RepID=UPI0030854668|nr:PEP-CTERM sorting domain-containing protein [Stieleria sp. HD01]
MLKKVLCFAVLATFASTASAGVMGHSILSLSNIVVRDANTNQILTGSFQGGPQADVTINGAFTTAPNTVSLGGTSVSTQGGAALLPGVLVPQPGTAFDPVSGTFTSPTAIVTSGTSSMEANSSFGGSFVEVDPALPGLPTGGFATTSAEFDVDVLGLTGAANANIRNTSNFDFTTGNFGGSPAGSTRDVVLTFTATVDLLLTDDFAPVNFYSAASTNLGITLNGSTVFGPATGSSAVPGDLTQFISIPPSASPGVINFTDDYSIAITLESDTSYSLNFNQTASVVVGVVPEPSSFAAFGVLGLVTTVVRRRKR